MLVGILFFHVLYNLCNDKDLVPHQTSTIKSKLERPVKENNICLKSNKVLPTPPKVVQFLNKLDLKFVAATLLPNAEIQY